MHECPDCGQACDCDGEDTWNDYDSPDAKNCTHDCEEYEEDDLDDLEDCCPICYQTFGHASGCPRGAEIEAEETE